MENQSGKTFAKYKRLEKRLWLFVVIGLVASSLVFVAIAFLSGISNVANVFAHLNPFVYILGFACVFASYCVRFLKWDYFTRKMDLKISKMRNFLVYLSTNAANITPGGVGSLIAAYTMKKITKRKLIEISPLVIIDMVTDYFGFALFALILAIYINKYILYVILFDLILVVPYIFFINPWLFNIIKRKKRKGFITKNIMKYGERYYVSQGPLHSVKVYLASLIYTMPANVLNALALYFSLLSVNVRPRALLSIFTFSVAQMAGVVSAIPGGIGSSDFAFAVLLKYEYGLSNSLSSAVTILTRFAYLWFGVLVGVIALVYTIRKYWK